MQLFLDTHKTLLPRIDRIYFLSRMLTLVLLIWFAFFGERPAKAELFVWIVVGTYLAHLVVFQLAVIGKFDLKLAYLSAVLYDLIMVPSFIIHTGGTYSSMYLLFFLTACVAAYILTFPYAISVSVLAAAGYLSTLLFSPETIAMFDVALRVGFLLVLSLAVSYASDYLRRSERRLMKLFDTLNQRTSELEKSQAQLELIYENTRVLASYLDTDGLIKELTRIMGDVLQYSCYALILRDKRGNYFYRTRVKGDQRNLHLAAVDMARMELVHKVCDMGEPVRIKDITSRADYDALGSDARSVMIVPLVSHGVVMGVLTAESSILDHFQQRDEQMLAIVARSAALALENAELHRRTEELTIIDQLTQTYNYRYFVQKLDEEKRRAVRYALPLSLLMVDIDWFKKLNDTYGHEAGNMVLRQLALVIKSCIRDVDVFARYGGEEFAIILPQTSLREASHIGERMREQVEKQQFDVGEAGKVKITVSIGISSYPENGQSHEDLVSAADKALYQAKGEGRNLVCVL